jgi:hypothetical protein
MQEDRIVRKVDDGEIASLLLRLATFDTSVMRIVAFFLSNMLAQPLSSKKKKRKEKNNKQTNKQTNQQRQERKHFVCSASAIYIQLKQQSKF